MVGFQNAKRPLGFPAGAIPTVDFLLHEFGRAVKKVRVKSLDLADRISRERTLRGCDRDIRLGSREAKHPLDSRRAQFQLWIFSYTILVGSSKKSVSRLMIRPAPNI
jgi:hypothetical protein